jgi:hypothetical protein
VVEAIVIWRWIWREFQALCLEFRLTEPVQKQALPRAPAGCEDLSDRCPLAAYA